ncbi:MAG: MarR family winged helix-turn-helix transcriptional regulator [Solirubrobacteraceae bacterium]
MQDTLFRHPQAQSSAAGDGADTDVPDVARLRVAIDKLSRRLRPTEAGASLTPSQTSVLFTVVRRGPIGLAEVAEIERINPTMLSRIVAELCSAELISREPDPEDRRAARVRATAAGQRLRKRIHRERANALKRHIATLDARQRRALNDALPVLEALAEQIPRTSQ